MVLVVFCFCFLKHASAPHIVIIINLNHERLDFFEYSAWVLFLWESFNFLISLCSAF
uniref:Uncharacterized protein n=1 Tax=Anguilla anguilla TaxID=7936 RepID=A0A0E9PDA0_ANGAN